MADPTIHGNRRVFSASAVLDAIASDLSEIKKQDKLTDEDLGRVLGKGDDQAGKYRTGLAEMGIVAFAAGMREWNGRFTGSLFRLCEETRPGTVCDHSGQTSILAAALALSKALEDGRITPEEVRECRAILEQAKDAINAQLAKLTVKSA